MHERVPHEGGREVRSEVPVLPDTKRPRRYISGFRAPDGIKLIFQVLKNRMYFDIDKVPRVILACVLLYKLIVFREGHERHEVFVDDQPIKRARGPRSNVAAEQAATAAQDHEGKYLADTYLLAT